MQPTAHRTTARITGTEVVFETGRIARQAQGAVLVRCGDNVVLATVTAAMTAKPGQDFFPLTVEYREKFSAAGRVPGGYGRREGRISDHEVLVSRLIDRTLRSLFPDEWKAEVQVQVQVFSAEPSSDLESLAMLAACAALHVSPVPAKGPAGGLGIHRVHGQWVAFAGRAQREVCRAEHQHGIADEHGERFGQDAAQAADQQPARDHRRADEPVAQVGFPGHQSPDGEVRRGEGQRADHRDQRKRADVELQHLKPAPKPCDLASLTLWLYSATILPGIRRRPAKADFRQPTRRATARTWHVTGRSRRPPERAEASCASQHFFGFTRLIVITNIYHVIQNLIPLCGTNNSRPLCPRKLPRRNQ